MQLTIKDHVATLTLDQPRRANALDEAGWYALRDHAQELGEREDVHVILLRAEGKHFCAGMDLSVLGSLQQRLAPTPEETRAGLINFIKGIQDCITALEECPQPVIAAVQGGCIGGGVDLVTACDIRYCTEDAYFTVKEVDLGIVADIGTLQRLPKILHPGLVAELAYTGRKMYGPEAARSGLVNTAFPDVDTLDANVLAIAERIAAKPTSVIRGIKHNLLYTRENGTARALDHVAHYSADLMLRSLGLSS